MCVYVQVLCAYVVQYVCMCMHTLCVHVCMHHLLITVCHCDGVCVSVCSVFVVCV